MDIDKSKDYLSSGQSKRLLAFSIIAALTSLPMAGVDPAQLGIVGVPLSLGETLMDVAQSAIKYTFSLIAAAIFGTLGFLFTAGTYEFLFFKAPGQIPELRKVWWRFAQIFWWVLPVAGSAFFLGQMLFPEKEEADIYRFMERTLVAGIALLVTGPMFNSEIVIPARPNTLQDGGIVTVDLFSAAVIGVNEIGKEIFPSSYSLVFLQDSLNSLMGGLTALGGLAGTIIAAALLGWKFAIGVILTVAAFWLVLAMRMLLVYVVWAMMPLFLSLWVVDIGPMKYGKQITSLVFKLTAMLLLLGIVISGVLATTSAIAGQGTDSELGFIDTTCEGPEQDSCLTDYDEPMDSNVENGLVNEDNEINEETAGGTESAGPPTGFTKVLLQMFAWFGGIVLCIALTTSLLGMVISMRGGGGTSSRMRQGRSADAPIGPQVYGGGAGGGGGGGGGFGGAAAGGAAGGAAGAAAGGTVTSTGDGSTVIQTENQGTVLDDDGGVSTFAPDNPEPEPTTFGDKAEHIGNKGREKFDGVADRVGGEGTGESIRQTASETAGSVKHGAAAVAGKIPGSGLVSKGANIAKRGGKAYGSVFMTDGAMASVGEMGRIARESPIGHPDKQQPWNQGQDASGSDPIPGDQASMDDLNADDFDEASSTAENFAEGLDGFEPDTSGPDTGSDGSSMDNVDSDDVGEASATAENFAEGLDGYDPNESGDNTLGEPNDINLPEGKTSVKETLEDYAVGSESGSTTFETHDAFHPSDGADGDVDLKDTR